MAQRSAKLEDDPVSPALFALVAGAGDRVMPRLDET
jgi:hypothetical protein